MTQLESNALSIRAEEVGKLIAGADTLAAQSIDKLLEAGRLLLSAKEEAKHGEWLPFLKRAGVQERKAQRYMTLARSGLKSDTVTHLGGVKAALEFIRLRSRADAAWAAIGMTFISDSMTVADVLSNLAKRIDAIEELAAATRSMFECFPEEERERAEAQRLDAIGGVDDIADEIGRGINDFILADRSAQDLRDLGQEAVQLCQREDNRPATVEILLRVLMAINRKDGSLVDDVLSTAPENTLRSLIARAA